MYAEIISPKFAKKTFTYHIPETFEKKIEEGIKVKIPMRKKTEIGIIRHIHNQKPSFETKDILSIENNYWNLQKWQLDLTQFISEYYICGFGQALSPILPPKFSSEKTKINCEEYIILGKSIEEIKKEIESNKRFKKQSQLLNELIEKEKISLTLIFEQKIYSRSIIKSLLSKGLIKLEEGKIIPPINKTFGAKIEHISHKTLNEEQKQAFEKIIKSDKKSFLIHGITSSGKTEIYLQLAKHFGKQGKQALILVPEIGLTPQLIDYFIPDFGDEIAIIHSKITENEKIQEFARIKTGEAKIIIGSRSAIFAPFLNLGLIIMDEEHEWTYKQDETPRYHTKNIALKLTELLNCKLVLASATPNVETYHEALNGKHELLELKSRINHPTPLSQLPTPLSQLPTCYIVDLRDELKKGNFSIFSDLLFKKLTETLENKKQAILFLNRRGYNSSILCRDCGKTIACECSEVPMVLHKNNNSNYLLCHYCGLIKDIPTLCPNCQSPRIKSLGIGTQKIEDELHKLFPKIKTLRADRDTMTSKGSFGKIYQSFKKGEADVLIGTQMITKGLDLPQVKLVGIILADLGLSIPNFRSSERTFQLLTQVVGRTGRRGEIGEAVIQTYNPDNFAIRASCEQNFKNFYDQEIKIREDLSYPPFSQIIKLKIQDPKKEIADQESQNMENKINSVKNLHNNFNDIQIFRATALPIKKYNQYRYNIFIKGKNLDQFLKKIEISDKWRIDVDPV